MSNTASKNPNQLLADAHRLAAKRQYVPAEQLLRQVLAIKPRSVEALVGLGLVCNAIGRPTEAIELLRHALAIKPYLVEAHLNLGSAYSALGQYDDAIPCFNQAITLKPDQALGFHNLGIALRKIGKYDEAVAACRRAVALKPDYADAHIALGSALRRKQQVEEAAAAYREGARLKPGDPEAFVKLGDLLRENFRFDEAVAAYRQAMALKSETFYPVGMLATSLRELGQVEESVPVFRYYLERTPNDPRTHSGLLFALDYLPSQSPESFQAAYDEHVAWGRHYADPLAPDSPVFANDRSPDRRLRVGYISPDFRQHSVSFFIENLLQFHDPAQVEIFGYAHIVRPDVATKRIQSYAHHWRDITNQTHEETAGLIRNDQIDILVDLAGHSADNRLLVLARRPAPLQISYLGYVETTGVKQIDFRLVDQYTNPPGMNEQFYTEQLLRLPTTFASYRPPDEALDIGPLPALSKGHITFACLGVVAKVSSQQLRTWATLLSRVPDSRLLFAGSGFGNASVQERMTRILGEGGISADRLEFIGWQSLTDYLATHNRIDILLDMFPMNGHTITCNAAWMGVPTVSQAGTKYASRLGSSVLTNLGLTELLANTAEEYVDIAAALAKDLPRLAELRATLRDRMRASPIMNYPNFARDVESAYRIIWRQWCAAP